jgi:hypothetical protein
MEQSYDFILAINFPKLEVSTSMLDKKITDIGDDNFHILNLSQSSEPNNKNFSVLSTLNDGSYDFKRNKRYVNIDFDTHFFSTMNEPGLMMYQVISSDKMLEEDLVADLDNLLQKGTLTYQELIDFLKQFASSLGKKNILLIDLVGYTLDAEAKELEDEQIERMFSAPAFNDVSFFSEEKKNEVHKSRKGGKRKSRRKLRRKSMRKSYKK